MSTAVLDIEFEQLPSEISDLAPYSHALILVRLKGIPVGQIRLPVFAGRIGRTELRAAILEAVDWTFWKQWLHHDLDWVEPDRQNLNPPLATVAVCTHDRPDHLRCCLEALMRLPDDGQEIIIVDNCPSTTTTRRLVEQYDRVRYIHEPRPGLNHSRNRALLEAKHDIVAFTDDDATPDPNWLRALLRNYTHPLTLCVTGLTLPKELETEAQEWFERAMPFGRGFEHQVFERTFVHPLAGGKSGAGVNMSFRRDVINCVGGFDPSLDAGTASQAGGDNDMFGRVLAAGYRIVYEPQALVWHRHRQTWPEMKNQIYGYGIAKSATLARHIFIDHELDALQHGWSWFQRRCRQLLRSWLRRPGSLPADLNLALLSGFVVGPFAYLSARRSWNDWQLE